MIRISLFSLIGFVVVLYVGVSIGRGGLNPLHWFSHHSSTGDSPSGIHPVASAEKVATSIEGTTTRAVGAITGATTREAAELKMAHDRHRDEAAAMPHPVKGGLAEVAHGDIQDGLGHAWNGTLNSILHPHRRQFATTAP